MRTYQKDGLWIVERNEGHPFIVALREDGSINEAANNEATAKKYVEWLGG